MKSAKIEIKFETSDKDLNTSFIDLLKSQSSIETIELVDEKKFLGAFDTTYLFTFLVTVATSVSTKVLADLISDALKKGVKAIFINKKKIKVNESLEANLKTALSPNDED